MPREAKPEKFTKPQWFLVLLLALMNFAHILDFVIVMPLGDALRKELSITPQQFGHVVAVYGLSATVAGLLVSSVVDRFDRRHVLLLSFAAFAVATLLCGLSRDHTELLVSRGLAGAFGGVVASTIMAIIGDAFPNAQRGRAIGVVPAAFACASILGLPIGLLLADSYGRGAPFVAIAAVGALILAVAFWRLPHFTSHQLAKADHPLVQFWNVAKQPRHLICFAFMYTLVMGTFTVVPYLAPYLQANAGLNTGDIAKIYSVAGAVTLVMMILIGQLTDRFGQLPVFLVCAVGSMAMAMAITHVLPTSVVGGILLATGFMVTASGRVVPAQAMMLRSADPHTRGAFTNLNSAVSHLATGTAPLIAGNILGEAEAGGPLMNYGTVGWVAVGFGAVALLLSFSFRRAKAQQPVAVAIERPIRLESV